MSDSHLNVHSILYRLLFVIALAGLLLRPAHAQRSLALDASSNAGSSAAAPDSTADAGLKAAERLHGLSTFWKEVSYNFAFFDQVPQLDWDSTYAAFVPRVLAARDTFAYYRTLQRFCAVLRDGHTNVYFPRSQDLSRHIDFPPVSLQAVERRAIVADVETRIEDRIPVGSEILAVDGLVIQEKLRQDVFPYLATSAEHARWHIGIRGWPSQALGLLAGAPGSTARLTIRTPAGEERTVEILRDRAGRNVKWTKPSTPRPSRFEMRQLEDDITYIALNTFGDDSLVTDFRAALPELEQAKGLVIDLRNNGGGNTSVAQGVARHLLADSALGSAWRTREHVATYKAWGYFEDEGGKYRSYYEGRAWRSFEPDTLAPASSEEGRLLVPAVVLTSWQTASAAEDFLIYLDEQPHVTLVGGPTFGSTGQPLLLELPGEMRARVVTKRDTYPDGRDFVGYGIKPDVEMQPTVEDVRSDRDAVIARGLEVLHGKIAGN